MPLTNDNLIKSKSFALTSLLKNPATAKILFAAWAAPVGSTKRTQAKSILRSLNKSSQNYYSVNDGQGGIGNPFTALRDKASSVMNPLKVQPVSAATTPAPTAPALPPTIPVALPGITPPSPTTFVSGVDDIMPKEPEPIAPKQYYKVGKNFYESGTDRYIGITEWKSDWATKGAVEAEPPPEQYLPAQYEKLKEQIKQYPVDKTAQIQQWYGGLDSSLQDYYKDAVDAYTKGVGADNFAFDLMSDKDRLGKLLDLPAEVAATLPENGLLASHLLGLQESIEEKYNLDYQLDNLIGLQQRGLNIKNNLSDYIKGKDKYLGDIDKMIDDASTKIAYMDTSNPYVAKRMDNYLNYLTILKGRQEKRYTDFLNQSIDYHNAEITNAKSLFDTSLAEAEKEYNKEETLSTESYNFIKDRLKGIYETVENQTTHLNDKFDDELSRIDSLIGIESSLLNIQKIRDAMGTETFKKVTPIDVNFAEEELNKNRGADGYVNTEVWSKLEQEWKKKFGIGYFEKNFPPEEYLNPQDITAQKYFMTPLRALGKDESNITNEDLAGF